MSHFQLHCRNWNNFVSFTFHHFTIYVQQFKKVTIQCFHIPNWEIYDLLSLNSIHMSTDRQWKRGNYCIQAHPSLIQHKKPCNTTHKILSLVDLTPKSTLGPRLRAGSHGVPSLLRSMHAIYPLRAWNLGLTTSHKVPSHGCPHGNTLWRWNSKLVLRAGPNKKLDLTSNTNPVYIFA